MGRAPGPRRPPARLPHAPTDSRAPKSLSHPFAVHQRDSSHGHARGPSGTPRTPACIFHAQGAHKQLSHAHMGTSTDTLGSPEHFHTHTSRALKHSANTGATGHTHTLAPSFHVPTAVTHSKDHFSPSNFSPVTQRKQLSHILRRSCSYSHFHRDSHEFPR